MDWLKWFTLLVSVTSIHVSADAPKKKIRIHLPQKVKHIHHHKKIYITNHPTSSQYAPAFMPSAEGTVAMPTNVAMPAVANILPLNSIELYDEPPSRVPGISSAASKLLPLYHARGYYGPTPTDWDERDYNLDSPAESTDESYIPTVYAAPSPAPMISSNHPQKRVKIVKLNEKPRKKVSRKNKPKKVATRNKSHTQPHLEDEHPVTTFHEQFYSDVDGSGTIRKIKKPQRVEKIIDGDTEHIHTYSEEHIHKIVFDDDKHPRLAGMASVSSMSELAAPHSLIPIKNQQALIAFAPNALTQFTAVGSMGTPSHLEYASYNPREVTHDHIFHDHGEIPSNIDLNKNHLPFPTRTTYTSQGLRIGSTKGAKSKYSHKHLKPQLKPDFSYYENIYGSYNKVRSKQKPTISTPFELSNEPSLEDYRPVVPSLNYFNNGNIKTHNVVPALYYGQGKQVDVKLQEQQTSVSSPYSVSSSVVHEYKPKQHSSRTVGTLAKSNVNKNLYSYPNNNFEFDSFASPSHIYGTENYSQNYVGKKGKKKSISTQNISFGGLDQQTTVDHLQDVDISQTSLSGAVPTAFDNDYDENKSLESASSTAFTIRESSPVHPYYSAMAAKALHSNDHLSHAQASNDNYQYAEAPSPSTTTESSMGITTILPEKYYEIQNSEIPTESTDYEMRLRSNPNEQNVETHKGPKDHRPRYKVIALQSNEQTHTPYKSEQNSYNTGFTGNSAKLKYGDKI